MDVFTIFGRNYDSNIFVVVGKNSTIIDTGTGFYSKDVINNIKEFMDPTKIKHIILTHEHYDHVGGTLDILKMTDGSAKIFAHKNAENKLKFGKSSFAEMIGGTMPKIKIDVKLFGGEQIIVGDEVFEVIHTPGHSRGSICLYSEKSKSLFCGDTIFANGDFGRYDLSGGEFDSLLKSIEILSSLNVENLYPGHGPIVKTHGKEHILRSLQNIRSLI